MNSIVAKEGNLFDVKRGDVVVVADVTKEVAEHKKKIMDHQEKQHVRLEKINNKIKARRIASKVTRTA